MKYKYLINRNNILTEQINEKSRDLDKLSTENIFQIFSNEDLLPQKAVSIAMPEIVKAIDLITIRIKENGRLFYIGAGTSGRLGVLDAAECPPTFCTDPDLVQAIIAGGEKSLVKSSESLEDSECSAIDDLTERAFSSKDVLVGITAGGTTPYVISALKYAQKLRSLAIAISSVPMKQATLPCDIDIRLVTGPEVITGSTRLKAATATKMALNIISSTVMVKLGKVYGNQMIDLSVSNTKLFDRAVRIIISVAKIPRQNAIKLLEVTNGSVKLAILMAIKKIDIQQAKVLLKHHNYNIRKCIEYPIDNSI